LTIYVYNVEHLKLHNYTTTHSQLQLCFYTLYDPEVVACTDAFLHITNLNKRNYKTYKKYSKNYLLDVLELNIKSRCIFAWSGMCDIIFCIN
jgi:hypothetical protein